MKMTESNKAVQQRLELKKQKLLEKKAKKEEDARSELERIEEDIASTERRMKELEKANRAKTRKKRTHELIEVGAIVKSVVGFQFTEKNRKAFSAYLYSHAEEICGLMPDKKVEDIPAKGQELEAIKGLVGDPSMKGA